jgi:hypothetical protein
MKKLLLYALLICISLYAKAQDAISYQTPPKAIADLLLAKPTPLVSIDSKAKWMVLSTRNSYPSVEELAMPEFRIAGLRINPNNFSPSRQSFVNNLTLKDITSGKAFNIIGLPQPLFAGNISWSPGENKIAFTQTNQKGVDLYLINIATKKCVKINKRALNVVLGGDITWVDDHTLFYHVITKAAAFAPQKPLMPKGPTIQQNLGKAAPSATFEDLIKSPYDEQVFEFYATSQLVVNKTGIETAIGKPAIYDRLNLSPDKKYMLVKTLKKPFSYLVTSGGFPSTMAITDLAGKTVKVLAELPSTEGRPSGADNGQNVSRDFNWRGDEPETIIWCHPLDSGLIRKKVDFHDAVYALSAPFTGEGKELFKTPMRYQRTEWGISYPGLTCKTNYPCKQV